MKFRRLVSPAFASLALAALVSAARLAAQDQTVNGNLTVTSNATVNGNNLATGTQGSSSLGSWWLYNGSTSTDTLINVLYRSSASWLWAHGTPSTPVPAMRVDANHVLALYNSDGVTAGVALYPGANPQLALGNATLTSTGTALATNGAFTVASGITNTNGSFTGGASGLTLNAGGTSQSITLNSSGGDLIFKTNGTERARILSGGNVGIGTSSPVSKLDVLGPTKFKTDSGYFSTRIGSVAAGDSYVWLGSRVATPSIQGANEGYSVALPLVLQPDGGGLGVGGSPATKLQLVGDNAEFGISRGIIDTVAYTRLGMTTAYDTYWASNATASTGTWNFVSTTGWGGQATRIDQGNGAVTVDTASGGSNPLVWTSRLFVGNSGNVGVGTVTPTSLLEVAGAVPFVTIRGSTAGEFRGIVWQAASTPIATIQSKASTGELQHAAGPIGFGGFQTFSTNGAERLRIDTDGNVAVGTSTADALLTLRGENMEISLGRSQADLNGYGRLGFTSDFNQYWASNARWISGSWNYINPSGYSGQATRLLNSFGAFQFDTVSGGTNPISWNTRLLIANNGNVGIGTTSPSHKLAVNGTIRAKEVIVDTGWADYVFDENYRLAPLSEIEAHIKTEKHLPGIPSAQEVEAHGVSMGDMQAKLLSKVEELTLHLIAQEKEIAALRAEVAALRHTSVP